MQKLFEAHTQALISACRDLTAFHFQVEQVLGALNEAFARNGKVLIAGNGGSAAEAQHFSDELVGRYRSNRRPYPVIALTADSMVITCIGNDFGYENVFSRQIEALGQPGDIFIGLTTSGKSANILLAAKTAKSRGMKVVALTGPAGPFKDMADYAIVSPSDKAAIVQELHLHAIHLVCEGLEPTP
jgi:D-sedoheptulose 7-phosphate isomerase